MPADNEPISKRRHQAAAALGRRGGKKGGAKRTQAQTEARRTTIAKARETVEAKREEKRRAALHRKIEEAGVIGLLTGQPATLDIPPRKTHVRCKLCGCQTSFDLPDAALTTGRLESWQCENCQTLWIRAKDSDMWESAGRVDPSIPENELQLRDQQGNVIVRIVNLAPGPEPTHDATAERLARLRRIKRARP